MSTKTLSDFMTMRVVRKGATAELIVAYTKHNGTVLPVRLLGFADDAAKSDSEIREAGFHFYLAQVQDVAVEVSRVPAGDSMGTTIAATILKTFGIAVVVSAALIAAAWLLTQKS